MLSDGNDGEVVIFYTRAVKNQKCLFIFVSLIEISVAVRTASYKT